MPNVKCLSSNMYKATLTSNQDNYQHKIYYGITKTKFKGRCANHIKSLSDENHQSNTEFSNELWSIKTTVTPQISYGKYFENA